jgi:glutathione S-transferase
MLTGREALDPEGVAARRELGEQALAALDRHLAGRAFVVGDRCSIADLALFAYTHVAPGAGIDLARFPAVGAWIARVEALPGFVDDCEPYPANMLPGAGQSIYG